ncbi:unnamed protein product [Heterobilharzia americana]|nr:unnamed protein product [Heterobilharzia americana]
MDTKLKLLHLGKHMHHNSSVAEKMLGTYNTTDFVSGILDTLTILETRAPLHVHSQIDLLIKRLSTEFRPQVRQSILWNLITLAENVSHHFDKSHFLSQFTFMHAAETLHLSSLEYISFTSFSINLITISQIFIV